MSDPEPHNPESEIDLDRGTILFIELIVGVFIGIGVYVQMSPYSNSWEFVLVYGAILLGIMALTYFLMGNSGEPHKPAKPPEPTKPPESTQQPSPPNKPPESGFDVGAILFIELIAGAFIGILLYFYLFPSQVKDQTCMLFLVLGYAGFVLWIMAFTYEKACPACNRVFARELVWTQETDRRKGYKTVEREEKNRNGDVVRRWNEQVRILTISYEDRYACNNCGERWSVKRQREYDSFDE